MKIGFECANVFICIAHLDIIKINSFTTIKLNH